MVYVILLMCIPVLGWTILGIIPNKYFNKMIDSKNESNDPQQEKSQVESTKQKEENTLTTSNWAGFAEKK